MPEPVILIFDIGKTNKKYFLINEQYKIVYSGSEHFTEIVDEDGFPCDNIKLIAEWITSSINNILQLNTFRVKAINFSAHGAGIVNIDADGKIVTPLFNYLKPYPVSLTEKFCKKYGSLDKIALQTASPVLGNLNSGMQLYRLKYEQPETYSRITYALHLPQYLSFLVSRNLTSDITSIGCHTMLWDFKGNKYHNWVLNEQLDKKFPPIHDSDFTHPVNINNDTIPVGIGLHDSSSALIPYLINFSDPFTLISTGTWSISLNPFNQTPLTTKELKKDCLCYLSYKGKPVKASRLFAGYYHDKEVERIASYFNVRADFNKEIAFNQNFISENDISSLAQRVNANYNSNLEVIDLSKYNTSEEAYHKLMLQLVVNQVYSTQLVLKGSLVNKLFVEGGFSKNRIYMKLLSSLFPGTEVYVASIGEASAVGAALAIHNCWNNKSISSDLIELVLEKNNFVEIHKSFLTNFLSWILNPNSIFLISP